MACVYGTEQSCDECRMCGKINKKMSKADKIRGGSDLYIAVQIAGCIVSYLVQNKIIKGAEEDNKELISGISDDVLKWLESECET